MTVPPLFGWENILTAFDGRDYLTLWLVGHPLLARRLRLHQPPARRDELASEADLSPHRVIKDRDLVVLDSVPAIGAAVCCARSSGLDTRCVTSLPTNHFAAFSAIPSPASDSRNPGSRP